MTSSAGLAAAATEAGFADQAHLSRAMRKVSVGRTMRASHQGFLSEIEAARVALNGGDHETAFAYLERAHLLGQLRFVDHVLAHLWMLRIAWARHDAREIRGQLLRLDATVPGHLFA